MWRALRPAVFVVALLVAVFVNVASVRGNISVLSNGDFSNGLAGWTTFGNVSVVNGAAFLEEAPPGSQFGTSLQLLAVLPGAPVDFTFRLRFDQMPGGVNQGSLPDVFQGSLLFPTANAALEPFLAADQGGIATSILATIGSPDPSGFMDVRVDLSSFITVSPGTQVLIAFDLFGGLDGKITTASIDNVSLTAVPAPGAVGLALIGIACLRGAARRRKA